MYLIYYYYKNATARAETRIRMSLILILILNQSMTINVTIYKCHYCQTSFRSNSKILHYLSDSEWELHDFVEFPAEHGMLQDSSVSCHYSSGIVLAANS